MTRCQLRWNFGDDQELELRIGPLRDHWEARGPGMLSYCKQQLPWLEIPECMEIQLCSPQRGGGGRVLDRSTIAFEAVLANRHPQLPEVVRLAWLVLSASETLSFQRQAALVPVILAAAEHVELARCDAVTTELALTEWLDWHPGKEAIGWFTWWSDSGRHAAGDAASWTIALEALKKD